MAIVCAIVIAVNSSSVCAESLNNGQTGWKYPTIPGTEEWDELETVESKLAACRIPQDVLLSMTDDELVQAVIDYPFIIDVFLNDDYRVAVDSLISNCDALRELLRRGSAKPSIMRILEQRLQNAELNGLTSYDEIINDALCVIVGYIPECCECLTRYEAELINSSTHMICLSRIPDETRGYIYTPNGTPVYYTNPYCIHNTPNYHSTEDSLIVQTYGVTPISSGTCVYNCHSYAWYSTSTNNTKWINNPSAFITDGSYTIYGSGLNINSTYVQYNHRVIYGTSTSIEHSGIISDSNTGTTLGNRHVKSKWGKNGVFEHLLTNVPSSYWNSGHTASAWG